MFHSSSDFRNTIVSAIQYEMAYINFHTDDNPNGELRGQIINELIGLIFVATNEVRLTDLDVAINPNSVQDRFFIQTEVTSKTNIISIFTTARVKVKSFQGIDRTIDVSN